MSWFKDWVTGGLDKIWDKGTDVAHQVTGTPTAAEKRVQMNNVNDQVKAYKEQTELTRNELNNKRSEAASEKRRVAEKQVRALRRNYRASGFLGSASQQPSQNDMTSKLGG